MDLSLLFSQLFRINGLNIWEGLSHVGGREVYADTLRVFCGELERKTTAIGQFLAEENWKEYTIAVHAVKGALAEIGVWELSEKSMELEDASHKGNHDLCRNNTAALLAGMADFALSLRDTILFEQETKPREPVEPSLLEEKLKELYNACMSGSSSQAESLARELKTKTHNEATDALVDILCGHVESLDYDLAIQVIETALAQLRPAALAV